MKEVRPLVDQGLNSILLFPVIDTDCKPTEGRAATDPAANPVLDVIKDLKQEFGDKLIVACDVCLCGFTFDGSCCIYRHGSRIVDNEKSIDRLADISEEYAKMGADVIAPSDMMDGRIGHIKKRLNRIGLGNKVGLLSYSAKFESCFYGPFRDAANSAPSLGDRKWYQLPPTSRGLASTASDRDVEEGADFLMVKPGISYLDIVRDVKNRHPNHPIFIYQVSGEYAMLSHGASNGAFELKKAVLEVLASMKRAGADVIITYFAPKIIGWIKEQK